MALKRYSAPLGRCAELVHKHPERTARRTGAGLFSEITFQVWPNRKAMARSIRMQQQGPWRPDQWRALVPLTDGEGY